MWSHLPLPIGTYSLIMAGHRWNRWKVEGCEGEWLRGGLCVTCRKSVIIVYSNNLVDGRSGRNLVCWHPHTPAKWDPNRKWYFKEASTQEIHSDLWRWLAMLWIRLHWMLLCFCLGCCCHGMLYTEIKVIVMEPTPVTMMCTSVSFCSFSFYYHVANRQSILAHHGPY